MKVLGIGVGILVTLFVVYNKGKKAKAVEIQAKTTEKIIEVITKDKAIEKSNNDIGAKRRRERLFNYASDDE